MSLAPEDLARANCYAILARLFQAPPDAGLLAALAASFEANEDVTEDAALPAAWNELSVAAGQATAASAGAEFSALFIAIGKPQVVLYASWYLTGFMMEKPLAALRDDLAALGLARQNEVREPEDHFAALMEAMRHLVGDVSRLEDERLALQQKFFLAHIDPWCEKLCDALDAAPEANLYRAAGNFTRGFLALEKYFFKVK